MRGLLATLSLLSALASLIVGLTYLLKPGLDEIRVFSIILWAATLTIALIFGAIARKQFAKERSGLARSTVALFISVVSLIVGIVAFLI